MARPTTSPSRSLNPSPSPHLSPPCSPPPPAAPTPTPCRPCAQRRRAAFVQTAARPLVSVSTPNPLRHLFCNHCPLLALSFCVPNECAVLPGTQLFVLSTSDLELPNSDPWTQFNMRLVAENPSSVLHYLFATTSVHARSLLGISATSLIFLCAQIRNPEFKTMWEGRGAASHVQPHIHLVSQYETMHS